MEITGCNISNRVAFNYILNCIAITNNVLEYLYHIHKFGTVAFTFY